MKNRVEIRVRRHYDRLARIYDRRWSRYVGQTLSFLRDWAQIPPDARVLDVACGTGELERLLLEKSPAQSIVGVDLSPQMLAVARQKCQDYAKVRLLEGSAIALPLADESFDFVLCANAFHYFANPDASVLEMRRVMVKEGRLIIIDWCKDFPLCWLCDVVLQFLDSAHQQCYTQAEFHRFIDSAGLTIERSRRVRLGWIWGLMVVTAVPTLARPSTTEGQEVSWGRS